MFPVVVLGSSCVSNSVSVSRTVCNDPATVCFEFLRFPCGNVVSEKGVTNAFVTSLLWFAGSLIVSVLLLVLVSTFVSALNSILLSGFASGPFLPRPLPNKNDDVKSS